MLPTQRIEVASALAAFVHRATGQERAPTLARYSLFVEAALRPTLREKLAETAEAIPEHSRAHIHWAMIDNMSRRLTHESTPCWRD